jgi:hypothetical protein
VGKYHSTFQDKRIPVMNVQPAFIFELAQSLSFVKSREHCQHPETKAPEYYQH